MMKEIGSDELVSTNAPALLDGQSEWVANTAYAAGKIVARSDLNALYRAVYAVADTETEPPEDDIANNQIPKWQAIGPMNQWGAFDGKLSTVTVGPDGESLVMVLQPGIITDVWLGGLKFVSAVRVVATNGDGGPVVYDETKSLRKPVTSWWDWWFAPFSDATDVAFTGIPAYRRARVTITLVTTGTASVGMIAMDRSETLGRTLWEPSTQHRNYSARKLDDTWGPTGGTGGVVTRDQSYTVIVEPDDAPRVARFMDRAMKSPAVWLPDDAAKFEGIRGFGQAVSSNMSYPHSAFVQLELTIRGFI
ncbi:hypothetical protein ACMHYJ_03565 [Castellaniella hirudinis]|uniref:hypothetical protein n=1 Tax=Castellaniella hirudinis TaxID=1144617 RepID=UPI0039C1B0CB